MDMMSWIMKELIWISVGFHLEDLKKGTKVYPLELIPYILEPGKENCTFCFKNRFEEIVNDRKI